MSPQRIVFEKTGKEIKSAVHNRRQQLQARIEHRNQVLNEFLKDDRKVRSYIIRSSKPVYGHGGRGYALFSSDEISSEEMQEVTQLCQRIYEIEQELHRLSIISTHLSDEQIYELDIEDLIGYGFEANLGGGFDASA